MLALSNEIKAKKREAELRIKKIIDEEVEKQKELALKIEEERKLLKEEMKANPKAYKPFVLDLKSKPMINLMLKEYKCEEI